MSNPLANLLNKPVVLVGLMGSGKSTVGRRLANKIKLGFIDSDNEIENAAGCSIADIFEMYGEKAFRDVEEKVLTRLLREQPIVLATGGGAFISPIIRKLVSKHAISIWLRADLEVLLERTGRNLNRPLLRTGDPRNILQKLMTDRHPIYQTAVITVDTSEEDLSRTVTKVHTALSDYLVSQQTNETESPDEQA